MSGWTDSYLTAVIFINISCAFDMVDNILSKAAQEDSVDSLSVAQSRLVLNFAMAQYLVTKNKQDVWSVPHSLRGVLGLFALI